MTTQTVTTLPVQSLFFCAFAAGLLNLLPQLLTTPNGDAYQHFALIECMYNQFSQGDFYPRWCMQTNAGMGTPLFFFYFPLPYYLTLLFYPLTFLGVAKTGIFLWGSGAANMLTFLTAWYWLAQVTGKKRALLAAFLLLWMPYRMEVALTRSSYAELWCIAFLPLVFHYMRAIVLGEKRQWLPFGLSIAICLLCHAPSAFIALIGCGIYLIWMARGQWRIYLPAGMSLALAAALCAWYFLPARYFLTFMNAGALEECRHIWSNDYISLQSVTKHGLALVLITSAATVLIVCLLGFLIVRGKRRIIDSTIYREAIAWLIICVAAGLLSFEATGEPIWSLLGSARIIATPWRMRLLIMFAAIFLFAVKIRWLTTPKQEKTWKVDYSVLCSFIILMGMLEMRTGAEGLDNTKNKALKYDFVLAREYQTRWMDHYLIKPFILNLANRPENAPRASIIAAQGTVQVTRWDSRTIEIDATASAPSPLRIEQFYFPCWLATIDGVPQKLLAERHYGRMLLDVPAGAHHITITRDDEAGVPKAIKNAKYVSFAVMLLAACLYMRRKKKRV